MHAYGQIWLQTTLLVIKIMNRHSSDQISAFFGICVGSKNFITNRAVQTALQARQRLFIYFNVTLM